jgi:hypothetical protein
MADGNSRVLTGGEERSRRPGAPRSKGVEEMNTERRRKAPHRAAAVTAAALIGFAATCAASGSGGTGGCTSPIAKKGQATVLNAYERLDRD